ncbi:MAG: sulfurtransferase TusA family protein [Acidiferrobacterales bacterium]
MKKLDVSNLLCPMPVIRTQDKVVTMAPGEKLEIVCTDPGALHDIPAWCRINGHRLVSSEERDKQILITIEVGEQ